VLDQVAGDLKTLRAMMAASADLVRLIRSPVLGRADQAKAVTAVAEKAGFHDLTCRFAHSCPDRGARRGAALGGRLEGVGRPQGRPLADRRPRRPGGLPHDRYI